MQQLSHGITIEKTHLSQLWEARNSLECYWQGWDKVPQMEMDMERGTSGKEHSLGAWTRKNGELFKRDNHYCSTPTKRTVVLCGRQDEPPRFVQPWCFSDISPNLPAIRVQNCLIDLAALVNLTIVHLSIVFSLSLHVSWYFVCHLVYTPLSPGINLSRLEQHISYLGSHKIWVTV